MHNMCAPQSCPTTNNLQRRHCIFHVLISAKTQYLSSRSSFTRTKRPKIRKTKEEKRRSRTRGKKAIRHMDTENRYRRVSDLQAQSLSPNERNKKASKCSPRCDRCVEKADSRPRPRPPRQGKRPAPVDYSREARGADGPHRAVGGRASLTRGPGSGRHNLKFEP